MKVFATRPLPGPAWTELLDVSIGSVDDAYAEIEVLIVANEMVDGRALDRLPALRLIANFGVGYDRIDVAACRARGVAVTNTPGVLDAATADVTFALMLAARRRIVEGDQLVRAGRWASHWSAGPFLGREVNGATLGIVGLGRIGSAVMKRAVGFDMRVLSVTRREGNLDELLRASDIVTLHVPLTSETAGLLSRERLALLRDGATLVNTARGAIIDMAALVDELVSGRITAGLDVFVDEPNVPNELLSLPNVVLTPHIASSTVETRAEMTRVVVDNVLALERGAPLLTPVQ
ncbi:MAG TPA: D-glycerate dehydrogenase [Gaiellaceae bacterium]|nr:D-glycerate dehydrogenase [Gaiellaceae bacterium]